MTDKNDRAITSFPIEQWARVWFWFYYFKIISEYKYYFKVLKDSMGLTTSPCRIQFSFISFAFLQKSQKDCPAGNGLDSPSANFQK